MNGKEKLEALIQAMNELINNRQWSWKENPRQDNGVFKIEEEYEITEGQQFKYHFMVKVQYVYIEDNIEKKFHVTGHGSACNTGYDDIIEYSYQNAFIGQIQDLLADNDYINNTRSIIRHGVLKPSVY